MDIVHLLPISFIIKIVILSKKPRKCYTDNGDTMTREERNEQKQKEIIQTEKKEKIKKIVALILKTLFILIAFITSIVLYARYIGATGLVIHEEKIESSKIPDSFHGFKIIQFSDLHYGSTIFQKEVEYLVEQINLRKPDLILFTGDLIDKSYSISEDECTLLATLLQKMDAKVGKYAVTGNHDYPVDSFYSIMEQGNFIILDNRSELIYYEGYEPILLTGLNSSIKGDRDIPKAFQYFNEENHNPNIFTITMLHEPDSIDNILSSYPVDLALAGHSHNGQIRIPFVGSIVKINGAKKYSENYYQIDNTKLYISGGIGTSTYPFRLFNKPSINFFRITKK